MRDAFGSTTDPRAFAPDYDVRTDGEAMRVELDVPGLKEADLVVEVREGLRLVRQRDEEARRRFEVGLASHNVREGFASLSARAYNARMRLGSCLLGVAIAFGA